MTNENIEKVNNYLTEAGMFFLASIDKNQPKIRPLGFHMVDNDKIYFAVGTFKEVYKQITKNPKIEICACKGTDFLRYYGDVVIDENPELSEKALDTMPNLREIYNEETGYKLGVFHLENATAEFRGMLDIEEKIEF